MLSFRYSHDDSLIKKGERFICEDIQPKMIFLQTLTKDNIGDVFLVEDTVEGQKGYQLTEDVDYFIVEEQENQINIQNVEQISKAPFFVIVTEDNVDAKYLFRLTDEPDEIIIQKTDEPYYFDIYVTQEFQSYRNISIIQIDMQPENGQNVLIEFKPDGQEEYTRTVFIEELNAGDTYHFSVRLEFITEPYSSGIFKDIAIQWAQLEMPITTT